MNFWNQKKREWKKTKATCLEYFYHNQFNSIENIYIVPVRGKLFTKKTDKVLLSGQTKKIQYIYHKTIDIKLSRKYSEYEFQSPEIKCNLTQDVNFFFIIL